MTPEEIQKRIETAKARRAERLAPTMAERAAQKKATEWLVENGVIVYYTAIPYAKRATDSGNSPKLIEHEARLTCAIQKAAIVDDVCKLKIAYTIMSQKDKFSRPVARKLLADRLQSSNSEYTIELDASVACVNQHDKLYEILTDAIDLRLLSRPETLPTWLQKGMQTLEEASIEDFEFEME